MKLLAVNADDFGFSRDVNLGIVEAHVNGILTAATLMANGREFRHAATLAREHPALDIGCHLVLVQGHSLLTGKPLPASIRALTLALIARRIRPYEELKRQVERIVAEGLTPTHLDTHKHTHLLPPVLDAVARLSEEFRIPWVRRPFDFPMRASPAPFALKAAGAAFSVMRLQFHRKLKRHGCRTTDFFAGFQLTGRFQARQLIDVIQALPDGSTEFMCHPGYCTDELRCMPTRLKEARQRELQALTDPAVRKALAASQVRLVSYRELGSVA